MLAPPQVMAASIKEVRDRIGSVSNTKKITEAMKLVAAAKVRRAQEAVVNGRPFAENLVKVRTWVLGVAGHMGAGREQLCGVQLRGPMAAGGRHGSMLCSGQPCSGLKCRRLVPQ